MTKRKQQTTVENFQVPQPESGVSLGTGDIRIGRTLWDLLSLYPNLSKRHSRMIYGLVFLTILGALTVIYFTGVQFTYKDYGLSVVLPGVNFGEGFSNEKTTPNRVNTAELAKKARELGKPYYIIAITDTNRVEKKLVKNKQKIIVYRNTVYTLQALRKISKSEKVFKQEYPSDEIKPQYIPGTENEVRATDGTWNVELDMEEGEIRTITTAAVFSYDFPLGEDRMAFYEQIHLNQNEQFISYLNSKNVIGELVMRIESEAFNITPVGNDSARRHNADRGMIESQEVRFAKSGKSANSKCSKTVIATHWTNIVPNEEIGILFTIDEKPAQQ